MSSCDSGRVSLKPAGWVDWNSGLGASVWWVSMKPESSARAMKRDGEMSPRLGWFQRTSASALTMAPLLRSHSGW